MSKEFFEKFQLAWIPDKKQERSQEPEVRTKEVEDFNDDLISKINDELDDVKFTIEKIVRGKVK